MKKTESSGNKKAGAIIRKCVCSNESQDALHGRQNRVANICKEGAASRCTSCGSEKAT